MEIDASEDTGTEDTELEEGAEGEEGVEAAPEPEVDPAQFDGAKFKLTVNGKEVVVEGKALKAAYQRGESGAERLREAAELRKQVQEREAYLKDVAASLRTPEGFLEYLLASKGDPMTFLKEVATLAKKEAELSPEARELREHKRKLEKYEKAEKAQTEAERVARETAETEAWEDAYVDAFEEGLEAIGVPDDDEIREELLVMIGRLAGQATQDGEDPYIEDLAKQAWETYQRRYGKIAGTKPSAPAVKKPVPGVRTAPAKPAPAKDNGALRSIKDAGGRQVRVLPTGKSFSELFSKDT